MQNHDVYPFFHCIVCQLMIKVHFMHRRILTNSFMEMADSLHGFHEKTPPAVPICLTVRTDPLPYRRTLTESRRIHSEQKLTTLISISDFC